MTIARRSLLPMGMRSVQLGWSSGMQRALCVDAAWTRHAPLWPRGPLAMTGREWLIQNGQIEEGDLSLPAVSLIENDLKVDHAEDP